MRIRIFTIILVITGFGIGTYAGPKKGDWGLIPLGKGAESKLESKGKDEFRMTLGKKSAKKKAWNVISEGKGAEYSLNCVNEEEFLVSIKRNAEKAPAVVQVCRTIDKLMHSQNKLIFSCRGYNDKPVLLHVLLSYKKGGKSVMCFGPRFTVKGKGWREFELPLDVNFKLGDASFHIWQLKFSFNINGAKPGTKAGVEMRNIRICEPGETALSMGKSEILVKRAIEKPELVKNNPLKIFCQFDNEDYGTVFSGRGKYGGIKDKNTYPGYRWMLFSSVEKDSELVQKPEEADIILYSGARPDPEMAKRVVSAVKNGTPLIAASAIADPEIAAILPVNLTKLSDTDYPERMSLKPVVENDKMFRGLNPVTFGVYQQEELKEGAKALLNFADGTPAIAEGKAGKGKVIFSPFAFGVDLIPGTNAHDAFLLRAVSYLTGRNLPVKKAEKAVPQDGWYAGSGAENFGRFGFKIEDGLTVDNINSKLDVRNGSQEYSFHSSEFPKLMLAKWYIKPVSGKDQVKPGEVDWNFKWSQIGVVELTAKYVIPETWIGKNIMFSAEGGIDDTAEVYFNGVLIGKVTADMPEYWMRPQRYPIPSDLIHFNAENEIKIISENLRGSGGFGACPELLALEGKSKPWIFTVDRVNWIGKGGVVAEAKGGKRRFDTSLAFPGIRWDIYSSKITMSLHNIADYMAYQSKDGIRILPLLNQKELPTDWTEPWILFFRDGIERPLLLVFGNRPQKLLLKQTGDVVEGIQIKREKGVGMLVPIWISGSVSVDSRSWKEGLPADIVEKVQFWYPKAFCFPVAATEYFRIDEKNKRIDIRTKYEYMKTQGDWKVDCEQYAPVSPLAYFSKGTLFDSDSVKGCGMITQFGEFALQDGTDTAEWSLPLPSWEATMIPRIEGYDAITKTGNDVFKRGVKFSAGGGAKMTDWTPSYPNGKSYGDRDLDVCKNLNMHGWLHGANQVFLAPYSLDKENQIALKQRIYRRLFEPVEKYQYKCAQRWREEPFSGIRYPVYFNNRHPLNTKFDESIATSINYADQNETAHMIIAVMQALADFHGQTDFVRANGNFIRHVARLLLISDDWAYLACHCRESGQSATIDMLNSEYPVMMKYARLGKILNDEEMKAQGLYRAARRLVPTVMRLPFKAYAAKNGLINYPENATFGVGFAESGIRYRTKGHKPNEVDLYDMSQGTPKEIVSVYRKYAPEHEKRYFSEIVYPYMFDKDGKCRLNSALISIVAQASDIDNESLKKLVDSYISNDAVLRKKGSDWPGMCDSGNLAYAVYRLAGSPVRIKLAKDLKLKDFAYDPVLKTATLELIPGADAELILESKLELADSEFSRKEDGSISIPLTNKGKQKISIKFL